MLLLHAAGHQRIFELHGDRAGHAPLRCDGGGLGGEPSGHVGEREVPDLARPHEITKGLDDLLDRRDTVPNVHPIEIDIVGAEPLE